MVLRVVAPSVAAQFCWLNVDSHIGPWIPDRSFDLATAVSVLHYLRTDSERYEAGPQPIPCKPHANASRTPCDLLSQTRKTQCHVAREMFRVIKIGGYVWIAHNGSYEAKWDPKRVWGRHYWKCCFKEELRTGELYMTEVSETVLFMAKKRADPTYSLILRRVS